MEKFTERLANAVQPENVEKYMEWLKNNPSIILTSTNDYTTEGVVFTCDNCKNEEHISDMEMNDPYCLTEWECKICTGDSPKRLGRAHTMMMRLN